jgi:uncharacterized membrane protein
MTEKIVSIFRFRKKKEITLDFEKCLDLAVDFTLLLREEADVENIKAALKVLFQKYKNDYDNVKIKF